MINQAFQNLKRQWGNNSSERENIVKKMRENLTERNNGEDSYTYGYTFPGKNVKISDCEIEELFKIDGDMNPLGK